MADGQTFIAMEYVPGRTLKDVIAVRAPLSTDAAVRYASQALDGLAAAHAVGIVHRDVKPQNLIVRDDGTLKVADFGVARSADETMLTQYGSVIGTADYISPEQARGAPAGAASDLYSVGVLLFEMLTGKLPFTGEVPLAIAGQHVGTPAPAVRELNSAVPPWLERVVERALRKDPSQRYGSAAEMKAALTESRGEDPTRTLVDTRRVPEPALTRIMPPAPTEAMPGPKRAAAARMRRPTRRHALATLGVLAALIGAAIALTVGLEDSHPRPTRLPHVLGLPVAVARSDLLRGGFDVRVGAKRHSTQPKGSVAAVRPTRASAARGSIVTLFPSSGAALVAVPSVAGFSEAAATARLQHEGLSVETEMAYASLPAGTAVGTAPAAGARVAPHSPISLTISSGPAQVESGKPVPPGQAKRGHGGKQHGKARGRQ